MPRILLESTESLKNTFCKSRSPKEYFYVQHPLKILLVDTESVKKLVFGPESEKNTFCGSRICQEYFLLVQNLPKILLVDPESAENNFSAARTSQEYSWRGQTLPRILLNTRVGKGPPAAADDYSGFDIRESQILSTTIETGMAKVRPFTMA